MKVILRILGGLYLAALVLAWWFMRGDTGSSWPVTLFLFSPRWALALPLLVLWPITVWILPRFSFIYIVHAVLLVFPIMGATTGMRSETKDNSVPVLRILTCNVGGGDVNTPKLIAMLKFHRIDVVLLQECPNKISGPVFEELGWNHRQAANMAVGSPYDLSEIRVLTRQPKARYNAIAGVACDVRWSPKVETLTTGSFGVDAVGIGGEETIGEEAIGTESESAAKTKWVQVVGVHFPTFRPAFENARRFDGKAEETFLRLSKQYNGIVNQALQASQRHAAESEMPTLVAGDFNVPVDSDFYRRHWGDRQNALSLAGSGFNHTKFTRVHGIRIDHVVVDSDWRVLSAEVGQNLGGDHCPVIAELQCKSW